MTSAEALRLVNKATGREDLINDSHKQLTAAGVKELALAKRATANALEILADVLAEEQRRAG